MIRTSLSLCLICLSSLGCGKPARTPPTTVGMVPTPFMAPGIRQPPLLKARDATLGEDAPIIGIVAKGRARAYSVKAMSPPTGHIVNDMIDDLPVSVTYCDTFECTRVFTNASRGASIELSQAGRGTDGLLIMYRGKIYAQATGKEPFQKGAPLALELLEHEITTWKLWREKHPDTEVYLGPPVTPGPNRVIPNDSN